MIESSVLVVGPVMEIVLDIAMRRMAWQRLIARCPQIEAINGRLELFLNLTALLEHREIVPEPV